jgi:ABC-type uncharacterized transport system auxiliary subunit
MKVVKKYFLFQFCGKFKSKAFLIAALLVFLAACKGEDKKKQFIEQEIKAAVDAYRLRRIKECQVAAFEKANMMADSIIRVKYTSGDSLALIGKPVKPDKIKVKSPLDTTPVQPLLPKQ